MKIVACYDNWSIFIRMTLKFRFVA